MADSPTALFQFWEHLKGRTVKSASSLPLDSSGFGGHLATIEFEDGSSLVFTVWPESPVTMHGGPNERWSRTFIPAKGGE
jgi:hypothetical protein